MEAVKETVDQSDIILRTVTPIVIIITFIIKEVLTYSYFVKQFQQSRTDFNENLKNTIEQSKKSWYLNVLIQPNVVNVHGFYDTTISILKEGIEELNLAQSTIPHSKYLVLSASKLREFKSRKREFEFNFINLLRSSSGKIAKDCTDKINSLDDVIAKTISAQKIEDVDFEDIERKIGLNKVEFLNILFTYMTNSTNTQ